MRAPTPRESALLESLCGLVLAPDAQRLVPGGARYFIFDTDVIPDQSGTFEGR